MIKAISGGQIMSALINPKPGDVVETPDGRLRIVKPKQVGYYSANEVMYATSKQPGANVRNCWITTWRDWCKKNKAVEASK